MSRKQHTPKAQAWRAKKWGLPPTKITLIRRVAQPQILFEMREGSGTEWNPFNLKISASNFAGTMAQSLCTYQNNLSVIISSL